MFPHLLIVTITDSGDLLGGLLYSLHNYHYYRVVDPANEVQVIRLGLLKGEATYTVYTFL